VRAKRQVRNSKITFPSVVSSYKDLGQHGTANVCSL
jgi:hypothetical protein